MHVKKVALQKSPFIITHPHHTFRSIRRRLVQLISATSSTLVHAQATHPSANPLPRNPKTQPEKATLTCFHVRINMGISSIACRRLSSLPFCVRSLQCPRTRCPTPVPLTRSPPSRRLSSAASLPLRDAGISSATPCRCASFTSSACRRSE